MLLYMVYNIIYTYVCVCVCVWFCRDSRVLKVQIVDDDYLMTTMMIMLAMKTLNHYEYVYGQVEKTLAILFDNDHGIHTYYSSHDLCNYTHDSSIKM